MGDCPYPDHWWGPAQLPCEKQCSFLAEDCFVPIPIFRPHHALMLSHSEAVLGDLCQGEEESVTGGRKEISPRPGAGSGSLRLLAGQAEMGSSVWVIQ